MTLPQVRNGGDEKQRVTLLFLGQMWQIHKFAGKDMEKMWQGHNFCKVGKRTKLLYIQFNTLLRITAQCMLNLYILQGLAYSVKSSVLV